MNKAPVQRLAAERLNRDAVQFDQNVSFQDQDAWPFWYPLIPYPFEETDILNDGLGLLGFELEPGEVKDLSIITERATVFRFLNTKFTINQCSVATPNVMGSTITVAAGNVNIVAAAAIFAATDVGRKISWLNDNNIREFGTIAVFNAANSIDIASPPIASAAAGTAVSISSPGTITSVNAAGAIVGDAQTTFTNTYTVGRRFSWVDSNGLERCGMIRSITDDQNMQLMDVVDPGQVIAAATSAHSPTKWVWWDFFVGPAPKPLIPLTFRQMITPLTKKMEVKLNIPSLKNIDFYGDNLYQSASGLTERRLPINVLQGEKNGGQALRTPDALVPNEGTISFQFANNHTAPVFVNAVAYGYKISMDSDSGA